ncbi:MAG TPA: hypothetical protein VM008_20145 [Phycisphaerae bacterium]|nr:hypothetical protein [Phycisphaerae bacterium]
MKVRALTLAVIPLVALSGAGAARAVSLYTQNFDSFPTAAGSVDGWWNYYGPSNTTGVFGVDSNGVSASQSLYLNLDASAEVGTDWYFYAGVGRSDIASPGSIPANTRPSDLKFSVDLSPSNPNDSTPVGITLSQWNASLNGNVWTMTWTPILATTGYTTVAMTLDTGTDVPADNVGGAASVFDPTLPISLNSFTFNSGHFPLAANVGLHVDNVNLYTLIPGDANADDHVDLTDLSIVLNNFGSTTSLRSQGNFDGNATVDLTDLSYVLNNFGTNSTPAANAVATGAPEPASISALAVGSLLLLRRRMTGRKA